MKEVQINYPTLVDLLKGKAWYYTQKGSLTTPDLVGGIHEQGRKTIH